MLKKSELEAKRVGELRSIADDLGLQIDGLLKSQIIEVLLANSEDTEDGENADSIGNADVLNNEACIDSETISETVMNTEFDEYQVEPNVSESNPIEQLNEYTDLEIEVDIKSGEDNIEISTGQAPYLQTLNDLHPLFANSDRTKFIHQIDGLVKVIAESSNYQKVECFLPGRGNVTGYIFK